MIIIITTIIIIIITIFSCKLIFAAQPQFS